ITREAKDAAGDVHDRMPAFLDDGLIGEWLAPGKLEKDEREHLHGVLGDVSETVAASLVTHPVDRTVNNVRTLDRSDSGLIAPIELG
ncbi:MAG: SOS response-associated peptidase family protein, partial [Brachybacterium tyrofermentans]